MTRGELKAWADRAWRRGADCVELLVMADAFDEAGLADDARVLREHVYTHSHHDGPTQCHLLGDLAGSL